MKPLLGGFQEPAYAVLRIVAGLMFAAHGAQKVFGVLGGHQVAMPSLPWVAGVIEVACGLMIALGLMASVAAFIASGEMGAAYFIAHVPKGSNPLTNGGELAILYCFLFLYMSARSAGLWAADHK